MALDDNNTGFYMPVTPANGGSGFGNGLGGDGWWILLLLLFAGGDSETDSAATITRFIPG